MLVEHQSCYKQEDENKNGSERTREVSWECLEGGRRRVIKGKRREVSRLFKINL